MNPTQNKVTIRGYLGQDPEVRHFQNGGQVANMSVSTSEGWKDKQTGEWREKTEWHRVAVFNKAHIDYIQRNAVSKGDMVVVEGKLETRKWQDENGNDRYSTEITVRPFGGEFTVIRTKASPKSAYDPSTEPKEPARELATADTDFDLDDDIPF